MLSEYSISVSLKNGFVNLFPGKSFATKYPGFSPSGAPFQKVGKPPRGFVFVSQRCGGISCGPLPGYSIIVKHGSLETYVNTKNSARHRGQRDRRRGTSMLQPKALAVVNEVRQAIVGEGRGAVQGAAGHSGPGPHPAGGHPRRGQDHHGPGLFQGPGPARTTGCSSPRT